MKKKKRTLDVEVINEGYANAPFGIHACPGDTITLLYRDKEGVEHTVLDGKIKERVCFTHYTIFKMKNKKKIGYGGLFEGRKE